MGERGPCEAFLPQASVNLSTALVHFNDGWMSFTWMCDECEAFTDAALCLTLDCFLLHCLCIVVIVRMPLSQTFVFLKLVEYVKSSNLCKSFLISVFVLKDISSARDKNVFVRSGLGWCHDDGRVGASNPPCLAISQGDTSCAQVFFLFFKSMIILWASSPKRLYDSYSSLTKHTF